MIEYVHSSAMNSTMLTPLHGTECKGLGKILGVVIGVVAAIAVPFLAPVIGTALGGGFFASIAGQALIGAGLGALGGAASSAVSGGSILKGALLGGAGGALTGGVGAWLGGAGLTTGAATGAGTGAGAGSVIDPLTGFETTAGATTGAIGATAGASSALASSTGVTSALAAPVDATTAAAGAAPAASTGVFGGISTGFKTAALQTLVNGGTQMLQSLAPDQQAELFKQMQAEMEVTRTQDAAAYAAQKKIFDEYYNFAKGINPSFFAQMERNNANQRLSATWAETERNMRASGANRTAIEAEKRRQEVEGAGALNTADAGGYMKGLNAQGSAMITASNLYPRTPTGYSQNLKSMYDIAGDRANDKATGIAGLTAPWAVYAKGITNQDPNARV